MGAEHCGELRERRAGAEEIRPHRQDHHYPAPRRGRRIQEIGEERGPDLLKPLACLVVLRAVGEDFLELVNHDQQPAVVGLARELQADVAIKFGGGLLSIGTQVSEQFLLLPRLGERGVGADLLAQQGNDLLGQRLSGSLPGRMIATGQRSLPAIAPSIRLGTRPASTTDDLPLPDGPSTPRNRTPCSARTSRRRALTSQPVRFSRPKKNFASRSRNASRPRYGQTPSY